MTAYGLKLVERLHIRAALPKNFLFAGADTGGGRVHDPVLVSARQRRSARISRRRPAAAYPPHRIKDLPDLLPSRWAAVAAAAA
jgi:hypothetical protein